MTKKKVLIISPGLPFPPVDGHKLKLYNLVKQLSGKFDLKLVVISNEKIDDDCLAFLNKNFISFKIFKFSRVSYFINLLRSIFNPTLPFQVSYYTFSKIKRYLLNNHLNDDYVIFNLIRTCGYIDIFEKNRVILDMVDSIGINYSNSKSKTTSFFYKIIYLLETKRLLLYEKIVVEYGKLTLLVNKSEADYYKSYGNTKWLPNGVNKALFEIEEAAKKPIVCFFGAMFYQPNVDAVLWFCKHVLPSINPDIKFYIIGGRPSHEIIKLQSERIIVTGFIDNPYELISSALCTVAPMQTGAGIQNKILESMGLGQITITNNLGALPIIGSRNLENILIANKPEEFIKLINDIYEKPDLHDKLKLNARNLIKDNYSWERYGELLIKYTIA